MDRFDLIPLAIGIALVVVMQIVGAELWWMMLTAVVVAAAVAVRPLAPLGRGSPPVQDAPDLRDRGRGSI